MLFDEKVYANICSMQLIPNVSKSLKEKLQLKDNQLSVGIVTLTLDDVGYVALDEATKASDVSVVYANSFYGGSDYASGPLSGEFIGIIAGDSPEEVKSGLDSIRQNVESTLYFEAIQGNSAHVMFAKTISSCGAYLAEENGVQVGQALAYVIAPPVEAMVAVDEALKAADVEICQLFTPPTETNFAGAILKGSQSSCEAAVQAFRQKVCQVATNPLAY